MKEKTIRYHGRSITVSFTPERCTHVAECLRCLPEVFDNARRPWINPDAASPDSVAETVVKCPTGALHFQRKEGGAEESVPERNDILISRDGPYYFQGDLLIVSPIGEPILKDTRIALCRCGAAKGKLICDGKHFFTDFEDDGKMPEANRRSYQPVEMKGKLKITPIPDGPLLVDGPHFMGDEYNSEPLQEIHVSLCRCGASNRKPYCDGNHAKIRFKTFFI